jgi:hypothetical protein
MSNPIIITYLLSVAFSMRALIPKTQTWMLWLMVATLIVAGPKETRLWNNFHYWINAKYFDELSYDQLYECFAFASELTGVRRNLANYGWVQGPGACKATFDDVRWSSFQVDIQRWLAWDDVRRVTTDKGFNGTVPWLIAGKPLANVASPDVLALIDPLLLAAAFAFTGWRIGWRRTGFAALWLLTFWAVFDRFWGNFLQYNWLALSIIAVVLMKEKPTSRAAGALIGVAASLYIFPAFLLWRRHRRVWEGAIAAGLAMGVLGLSVAGIDGYMAMLHNMAMHSDAIRTEPFNVGMANTLSGALNLDQWQLIDDQMSIGAGYTVPEAPRWWPLMMTLVIGSGWAGMMFGSLTLSRYYYTILVCYLIEQPDAMRWLFGINLVMLLALLIDETSAQILFGAMLMTMFVVRARRPYIKRTRAWIRDIGNPQFSWNQI